MSVPPSIGLSPSAALNFETKAIYSVTVTVSNGTATDRIDVTINVADEDEQPAITGYEIRYRPQDGCRPADRRRDFSLRQ